jgi:hypothetical protein
VEEDSCEHSNEPSAFVICWKSPEQPNDWRLLKKLSTPWSSLVTKAEITDVNQDQNSPDNF